MKWHLIKTEPGAPMDEVDSAFEEDLSKSVALAKLDLIAWGRANWK